MERSDFKGKLGGKQVDLYTLENANGVMASITNYGGRLVELSIPDRLDNFDNVVVGYSSMEEFLNKPEQYFGAIIGRYANRIAHGKFSVENETYNLNTNDGVHHLHGGPGGFHRVVWGANQIDDQTLSLSYRSPDGEEGYPGNLGIGVKYKLTDDNELKISYKAESDQKTILNLTSHPYFNLHGTSDGSTVYSHHLKINTDKYTPVDEGLIPTGDLAGVEGTPFDFRDSRSIEEAYQAGHPQIQNADGFDHNFVLNKDIREEPTLAASVYEPKGGRKLDIYTTEPGLQFYACSDPVEDVESAICLEPQHFPDSPNQPDFPSVEIDAFQPFRSETIYRFTCN